MSDFAEIKGMIEKINPTLVALRSEVDELKASQPTDVVTEEKHQKMADDITAKMDALQAANAKMQAAINRPGGGDAKGALNDEIEAKHRNAFRDFFFTGNPGPEFKVSGNAIEIKAMSTDANPDGGYLVRPELSNTVVTRIFETSPLRQVANVETTGAKYIDVLIDAGEAGARWVGEGASGGQTDTPELGQKVIAAHKLEADPRVTTEQLEDSYLNVEAWLSGKVARRFSRFENTAFVSGDGVAQPRGFLTYPAWAAAGVYEDGKIEQVNCGASGAVAADNIINLQYSLKEDYQPGATWGMKRATFGSVLQLKGNDNYFVSPVLMRDGVASLQLLGKPVIFMDDMEAEGGGNLCMVYADFSVAYTIVDRVGLQVLRDPYTNKGFITYYTTKRTGGDVTSYDGIKIGITPA